MKDIQPNYSEKLRQLTQVLKRKERQWSDNREKLSSALDHLTVAAEGQDASLDHVIVELRGSLRSGEPTPALINRLSSSARVMTAIRRSRVQKQLKGFSDCIAQLLLLDPPNDIKKQLAVFIRNTRKVIADPTQQEALPITFSRLQAKVLEKHTPKKVTVEEPLGGSDGGDETERVVDVEQILKDDSPVGEFPTVLLSAWRARRKFRAIFGTLIGVTEVFSLIQGECESPFVNYFAREHVTDDEHQAFQEFIFGLAFEELAQVRDYMSTKGISCVSPEEVQSIIKPSGRPPFFGYPTPDQMYASYLRRRTRAEYRSVSGNRGPRKTAEGYIMEGILRDDIDLANGDSEPGAR